MNATYAGLRAWIVQRFSALVVLGCLLAFAVRLLVAPPASFDDWRAMFAAPAMQLAVLFFFIAAAAHAWVGTRDVLIDYVKPLPLRLTAFALLAIVLLATLVWTALALLRL